MLNLGLVLKLPPSPPGETTVHTPVLTIPPISIPPLKIHYTVSYPTSDNPQAAMIRIVSTRLKYVTLYPVSLDVIEKLRLSVTQFLARTPHD